MDSAGGRCHDNARCESMWNRIKFELLYDRYEPEKMTVEELKVLILAILPQLLESSSALLCQWRISPYGKEITGLPLSGSSGLMPGILEDSLSTNIDNIILSKKAADMPDNGSRQYHKAFPLLFRGGISVGEKIDFFL